MSDDGNWLENAWDGLTEMATDSVDAVSDPIGSVGDTASDAWDSVKGWFSSEEEAAPVVALDEAPTKEQTREALETLWPVLREGYCRQEVYDRYGLAYALTQELPSNASVWGDNVVDNDDRGFICGCYRESERLYGCLVPSAVTDEVAQFYENGKEFQASWVAATEADEEEIYQFAEDCAESDKETILAGYEDLFAKIDLDAMSEALPKLNKIGERTKAIHDEHYDQECQEVLEVWEEWNASEVEMDSVKDFGTDLRSAVAIHWNGGSTLAYGFSMDATAQANAIVQAYNNIAETWELILEKMAVNAQEHATNKWVASIVINRIPFAGDAISTVDFVIEAASDGEIDSPVSQFFSNLLDKLTRKDVPNGETCAEIVRMLTDGTEECIEGLEDARNAYRGLVESDASEWESFWHEDSMGLLIPGYIGGS